MFSDDDAEADGEEGAPVAEEEARPRPQQRRPDQPTKREQERCNAVREMLSTSKPSFKAPTTTQRRLEIVCASTLLKQDASSFRDLLMTIQAGAQEKKLEPRLFAWARMYDETPGNFKTQVLDEASGALVEDDSTAKVRSSYLFRWW